MCFSVLFSIFATKKGTKEGTKKIEKMGSPNCSKGIKVYSGFWFKKMAFLRMKTSHNHAMGDVYSCFQKYVRRGEYESALYWGSQIGRENGEFKGYPNALKKRLMQHALEDVGNIEYALQLLKTKIQSWENLVPWIKVLCDMPKTRAAAWLNRLAVEHVHDVTKAPSDILLKSAISLKLHRDADIKQLALMYSKEEMKLYKELNKEVLVFHVLHLKEAGLIPEHPKLELDTGILIESNLLETYREVPEWAYDKHTSKGKRMGRGYAHFFETMVVFPKLVEGKLDVFEEEAKVLYLSGAEQRVRHILSASSPKCPALPPLEFENPLQAQLITGRAKPRVWFATRIGKQVVIKGPVSKKESSCVLKTQKIKECIGLPHTNAHAEGDYLVFDCLIDYTHLPTRITSSRIEVDVKVPVGTSIQGWEKNMLKIPHLAKQILVGLLFRKVIGANDTCSRNFMVIEDTVYSIDDAALEKLTQRMWKTKVTCEYAQAMHTYWDYLVGVMEDWEKKLSEYAFCMERLAEMKDKSKWIW